VAKDYYKILGIAKSATPEEVKAAFRRLAHQYHPDKSTGDEEKFKEINEANQVLSDTQKRAQYDQYGQTFEQAQNQGGGGFGGFGGAQGVNVEDLNDIFGGIGEMFGMGGRRRAGAQESRGRDLETSVTIPFATMVMGGSVDIALDREIACSDCKGSGAEGGTALTSCKECSGTGQKRVVRQTMFGAFQTMSDCSHCNGKGKMIDKKCPTCRGKGTQRKKETLTVDVPSALEDGTTLRLRGQGEAILQGTTGDLFIHIRIKPDQDITRIDGSADLLTTLQVNIAEAALGTTKDIRTIEGMSAVEVPEGVQSGQRLRLKGKGIQTNRGRGDLHVEVRVQTPRKLSRNAKKLLEDLQKEL